MSSDEVWIVPNSATVTPIHVMWSLFPNRQMKAMEEPLYATVKRTPRPPRSDFHVYHYPGEMPEFFIQGSCLDDVGASSSSVLWKESAEATLKDEYHSDQLLADCSRSGGSRKSYRYSQR
ncbi:uncharacterized protein NPIL_276552 [Nephila pilipes]|uniref:Uncharacterized protein n=1 Tax=Nephila pilipes TaxID=299642 RepID=A0A8X6QXG9_NEPPI|nr:uncharacterized protein NPIL_276552 [Nephila pilipes]